MGYTSKHGRRPNEYASKSAHSYLINDPVVQAFLEQCNLPKRAADVSISSHESFDYQPVIGNPIRFIIAIDGGYNEVIVQNEFPSATICFFQIGALFFGLEDLERLEQQSFIDPADITQLKQIQRLKFTLPVSNISLKQAHTLTDSIRRTLYDFFRLKTDDRELIETLRWFIFQEYAPMPAPVWVLSSCPSCDQKDIHLQRTKMTKEYTFVCDRCGQDIFLTDVFRLHEAIDDELGAGGILGYVSTTVEQMVLVHMIRLVLRIKPALIQQIQFIKDGPLAFFGQTANMFKPMRALVKYLFEQHNLYLAGLEKSGPFVEHADEISEHLKDGMVLILDNDYIYRYVLPGKADPSNPYGRTTYYGSKLIFKTPAGGMYVVSVPTPEILATPGRHDLRNLEVILTNIEKLKCDMYDNALIPVALANKLVSLANHPSSKILQKFAVEAIYR